MEEDLPDVDLALTGLVADDAPHMELDALQVEADGPLILTVATDEEMLQQQVPATTTTSLERDNSGGGAASGMFDFTPIRRTLSGTPVLGPVPESPNERIYVNSSTAQLRSFDAEQKKRVLLAAEERVTTMQEAASVHAKHNAQGIFTFVVNLSELIESVLPRDAAGEIIQSYANHAVEHFLLSIGALGRPTLTRGGHSLLPHLEDLHGSQPIRSWGGFVARVISVLKRCPLPPPPSLALSTLRNVLTVVDGELQSVTVDLMMTDQFWITVREHLSAWQEQGARDRDVDLSLLPEFLERVRGVPLGRVGTAIRGVCRDLKSLFLPSANGSMNDSLSGSVVIQASEVGATRSFSALAGMGPARRVAMPEPLVKPLSMTQERCIPHLQAVAVLHADHSRYSCGVTPQPSSSAVSRPARSPTDCAASGGTQRPGSAVLNFPQEISVLPQTPHTMFDLGAVRRMASSPQINTIADCSAQQRMRSRPSTPPSAVSCGTQRNQEERFSTAHEEVTLRSRLIDRTHGQDPEAAYLTELRRSHSRSLLSRRHRRPVRMVALEALIGLHEPVPGESIDEHWQRLLTMRFKLTVLRSSDMPPDQRDLWKHLWSCCFAGIDSIGEQLRTAIFGFKDLNSSSAAQCGKELQSELVSAAIAEALDEHLHLDKQLSEFNTRVRHNFERLVGEGGAAVTSKQRLDDSAVSAAPCSFARPVDRREKFESFLDRQFAQDGVAAINMIVERRLSSAKARRRPSSTGLSTSIIQSQPSRSSSSLFSGSAPNGYALQQRVFTSQTPSRASPNYPAELRVSSAAIVQRKK